MHTLSPQPVDAGGGMGNSLKPLRVVSFNVRNGLAWDGMDSWPFRRQALGATLAALDADLLGLQEVHLFQQRALLRALPGFVALGSGRRWGGRCGERCPFVYHPSRLELLDWAVHALPVSKPPRIATLARFRERRTRREFQVINTHLDHRSSELRRTQAKALLGYARLDQPVVVLGDFNETPEGAAVELLLRSGLSDTLAGRAKAGAGAATYHGFTGTMDGERIDLLLVSKHWRVADARIVRSPHLVKAGRWGALPSDHWPVSADLGLA